jgi:hypothetical protein
MDTRISLAQWLDQTDGPSDVTPPTAAVEWSTANVLDAVSAVVELTPPGWLSPLPN